MKSALLIGTLTLFLSLAHTGCSPEVKESTQPVLGEARPAAILPDMSQAMPYAVYNSNCRLSQLPGGGFDFSQPLLTAGGNHVNVTISSAVAGSATVDQRAHTAMRAALDIQKATGAEGVLVWLVLAPGLPKIGGSAAWADYTPAKGVNAWEVQSSSTQVRQDVIDFAAGSRRGGDTGVALPTIYTKPYQPQLPGGELSGVGASRAGANEQPGLNDQLFDLMNNFITPDMSENPYNLEAARDLIRRGADVNAKEKSTKQTPLIMAAQNGHIQLMKVLLEHRAEVNATDDMGQTALMKAAGVSDARMTRLLLDAGANPNLKDNNGWTALGMLEGAAEPGTAETRRLLKRAGAK